MCCISRAQRALGKLESLAHRSALYRLRVVLRFAPKRFHNLAILCLRRIATPWGSRRPPNVRETFSLDVKHARPSRRVTLRYNIPVHTYMRRPHGGADRAPGAIRCCVRVHARSTTFRACESFACVRTHAYYRDDAPGRSHDARPACGRSAL